MSRPRRTAQSSQELNRSVGSAVARAALKRSGAGAHGGSSRSKNRRDRQHARRVLRQDLDY